MKPNVFVISWKYSLIICAIISASFISIYLEIKKIKNLSKHLVQALEN